MRLKSKETDKWWLISLKVLQLTNLDINQSHKLWLNPLNLELLKVKLPLLENFLILIRRGKLWNLIFREDWKILNWRRLMQRLEVCIKILSLILGNLLLRRLIKLELLMIMRMHLIILPTEWPVIQVRVESLLWRIWDHLIEQNLVKRELMVGRINLLKIFSSLMIIRSLIKAIEIVQLVLSMILIVILNL